MTRWPPHPGTGSGIGCSSAIGRKISWNICRRMVLGGLWQVPAGYSFSGDFGTASCWYFIASFRSTSI